METDTLGIDLANPYTPCHGFIRRPAMTRLARLVSAAGTAMLIAACGGGGGGGTTVASTTAADPIDKYLGNWATGCIIDAATGTSGLVVFTTTNKTSATQASFTTTVTGFANANCTAPPTATVSVAATGVIDGPTTVPSPGVDKITTTVPGAAPEKDIALLNGNQLQFGNSELTAPKDAQGYPTTLDTTAIFIKQS